MEAKNELDVDDEVRMFCLHHVFLPKINHNLHTFWDTWNCHPMQSEHGLSPDQLWLQEIARYPESLSVS